MNAGRKIKAAFGQVPEQGESDGAAVPRQIPKGHPYNAKDMKPLAKMLWAMSVSMGHALTAYREFTRLKSSSISPDGLLGGRGYVMSVKEIRKRLYEACEALSAISDTVHDEINAEHWKPQLKDLDEKDQGDVQKYLDEAQEILDDPEVEQEEKELEDDWEDESPKGSSQVPGGGEEETFQGKAPSIHEQINKSPGKKIQVEEHTRTLQASTLPVETLPGPRVKHLQPERGLGPYGSENEDEMPSGDSWGVHDGITQENPYVVNQRPLDKVKMAIRQHIKSQSGLPQDNTPRDGYDWGLGWGANGRGVDDSESYVGSPSSEVPTSVPSDFSQDAFPHKGPLIQQTGPMGSSEMPNDGEDPVARSDYYRGPKGNIGDSGSPVGCEAEARLPGDKGVSPWGVGTPNSMQPMSQSGLPGTDPASVEDYGRYLPDGMATETRNDIPIVERPER